MELLEYPAQAVRACAMRHHLRNLVFLRSSGCRPYFVLWNGQPEILLISTLTGLDTSEHCIIGFES